MASLGAVWEVAREIWVGVISRMRRNELMISGENLVFSGMCSPILA